MFLFQDHPGMALVFGVYFTLLIFIWRRAVFLVIRWLSGNPNLKWTVTARFMFLALLFGWGVPGLAQLAMLIPITLLTVLLIFFLAIHWVFTVPLLRGSPLHLLWFVPVLGFVGFLCLMALGPLLAFASNISYFSLQASANDAFGTHFEVPKASKEKPRVDTGLMFFNSDDPKWDELIRKHKELVDATNAHEIELAKVRYAEQIKEFDTRYPYHTDEYPPVPTLLKGLVEQPKPWPKYTNNGSTPEWPTVVTSTADGGAPPLPKDQQGTVSGWPAAVTGPVTDESRQ